MRHVTFPWADVGYIAYVGYVDVAYIRYVKYAGVAKTAFWPQTDGQTEIVNYILEFYLRCYRSLWTVTTWPESSYDSARIRLRITEVHKEAAYEWNNNLIQTKQILRSNLQLARQRMENYKVSKTYA